MTAHIKANHGYDLPEIIATPITDGSAEYLSWLVAETRDEAAYHAPPGTRASAIAPKP